jgi:fructose 1,6-bisphosphatase
MLKVTSANDIVSYTTMQMVMESNKSIESFLNFKIKSSIDLTEQKYSIFSNPMDLYYILSILGDKERVCNSIIKNSNNKDIKEFIEHSCDEK